MTPFGWIYLALLVIGSTSTINEIGKPREPRTAKDVSFILLFSGLSFWALYVWGLR